MLTISLIVFTDKLQRHVYTFYSKWYFIKQHLKKTTTTPPPHSLPTTTPQNTLPHKTCTQTGSSPPDNNPVST